MQRQLRSDIPLHPTALRAILVQLRKQGEIVWSRSSKPREGRALEETMNKVARMIMKNIVNMFRGVTFVIKFVNK